jgi:hypothetical protein
MMTLEPTTFCMANAPGEGRGLEGPRPDGDGRRAGTAVEARCSAVADYDAYQRKTERQIPVVVLERQETTS